VCRPVKSLSQLEDKSVADGLAAARREGVIEGLERALRFVAPFVLQEHSDRIRAEIERLREEEVADADATLEARASRSNPEE
jgi:hypothetical protein